MAKTMENSDWESQPKTSIKAKLQDRELLDKLSALPEAPETDRIKITKGLIKFLSARQSSLEQDGICDEISYTVSRLVQGLSSHRKFARLGYSVALCQILKCFDDVKVEHVLECIDQKAQKQLSRQSSRGETTNVFLGKIFGYLTLVHSGRLFLEGRKNISQVVQQLLKLYGEKTSIQQLCMNALIQIIAQVKDKMFRLCILPEIKTKFTEGWGNCSPDTLLLLLYSNRYHKKKIAEFLTEHWLDPQLVSEKNFTLIAEVVKRSTCVYPLMHVVNEELVKSVVEQNLDVISFWKTVVSPLFDPKGKLVSKNTLGLHYFELLLPHLDTADKVENILHPDVADILCHTWEKQEDMRNRIANILTGLVELVKASEDAKLQLAVLKSLTMKPGHFLFDRKTKTNTISTIVSSLLPDAGCIFVKELMKMFSGQPSWLYNKDDNRSDCEQWAVKELDVLITMGDGSSAWQLDILQFLFLHTFFSVVKPSKDIVHCDHHTREMPESSRKWMTDSFFKTVSKCLSHSIQGQSRATVFGNHLDVLFQLVEYGQTLLDSKDTVKLHKDLSESAVTEWTKMLDIAKKINKKRQSDEKVGEKHAFELLFLHAGLELFSDTEGATESLQDLHVCYKKSNQRRKSKASDDGPEWIEVIIELLLSMVFKSSKNIAKLVLTALADHMTPKAFQLIVDVLQQKTTDSEEDGPLGMEEDEDMEIEAVDAPDRNIEADNDDDDDDNDDDDIDNEDGRKDEEEDDDSNEEESGTEEEANVAVDEELKKKVKTALGEAAVDSEEENNDDKEEEDLSDSEMFKFDKMLADAFICMVKGKKPKKEQESQLRDFKMRVMDLIYVIIKHHPTSSFVKDLVFPLLDLMGGGKKEEQSLRNRANDVFEHLYKVKKIIPDSSVDREELLTMISKLMQYPHKATSNDMVKQIAKAALLMIRVLLNIEDTVGPSPVKTRAQAKIAVQEKTVKVSKAWMDTHYSRVKDLASSDKLPSEVRLVLQNAIELPAIKDQDYYQEQVYKLVHTSLHKLLHKLEGHKSPLLTHTMIERYPLMFWSLSDDLVSAITDDKVKVYQKTQACGMLASLINKHVVAEIGPEIWQEFLTLFKEKSTEVLSTLTAENYKAQFMKELLTVYGKIRTISLEDCKKVLGETGVEKLGQLKTVFSTDVRGLYKKVVKQLVLNKNSKQESKKKKEKVRKRKQKDDDTETKDESSPAKAAKLENEPAIELTENNESKKKKKKDRKRQQSKDDDVSQVKAAKMKKKSISTEIEKEENIESKKKKKKDRKNQQSKDDIERKDEVSPVKAAKMKKNSIATETEEELNNEKKKKKKKDRKLQQSKDAIKRKDEVSQVKAAKMKNKPNVIETEKEEDNDAMNNLTNQEIRENLEETKNSLDLNDETNDSFMKEKRKSKKLKLKKGSVSLGMNNESISNELDLDESANADEENVKVEGNTPGKIDVSTPSKGNNDESTPSLKKKQKSKKRKMKEESGSYSMNDESISNELDLDGTANVDEENVKVEGKTLGKIKKNSNVAKATSTPAKGNNDKSTPSIENNEKNTPSKENNNKSTPSKGKIDKSTPSIGNTEKNTPSKGNNNKGTPSKGNNDKSTPSKGNNNNKSTPSKGNNDKSTPSKGNNNKSTPSKGNNDKSTPSKGNNNKSTPSKGNNDKSTPSIGNNEKNTTSKGNDNESTPSKGNNDKSTPSNGNNNKSTPSKGNYDKSNKETKHLEENGLTSPSLKSKKRKSVEGTAHTEVAKIVENSKNDTHEANPTMSAKTNEISSPSPMKKKQIMHRGSPSVESVMIDDVAPVPVNHSVVGVNGTEMDTVSVKETKPNRRRSSVAGTKSDKRDKFSPRYTRSMRKM